MSSWELMARAIESLYKQGHTGYWLPPLILATEQGPVGRIQPGDSVIFCCRRGEREIQLTRAFVERDFKGFQRPLLAPLTFVTLTLYHPSLTNVEVAFSPQKVDATLGEVISKNDKLQLRLTEKEKFAHVTYFFNGGRAEPFPGEVDKYTPSFLDDPLRSLPLVVSTLGTELSQLRPTLAVVNLASGDIVGHSEELEAKIRCAEKLDKALGEIIKIGHENGYFLVITADHGLLEDHGPEEGPPNVSHTTNPVPFIALGPGWESPHIREKGTLADVAPTVLDLLKLPPPEVMTGRSLILGREKTASKVLMIILDGWGLGRPGRINPIALAHTPTWDRLTKVPMARLEASGEAVGLLPGHKGNSEAGHMNLGAGRIVIQDEVRIDSAIRSGQFRANLAFRKAISDAKARGAALHLLGLLSNKSSHGSFDYVLELVELAKQQHLDRVFVHMITDGRSTKPGTAPRLLRSFGQQMERIGVGTVVTVLGRGLALDRGGDYQRKTQKAYRALVFGEGILLTEDQ